MAYTKWQAFSKEKDGGNTLDGLATQISTTSRLDFSRTGYNFNGWRGCAKNIYSSDLSTWDSEHGFLADGAVFMQTSISNAESVLLTATWNPIVYSISYVDHIKRAQEGVSVSIPMDSESLSTEYTIESPGWAFPTYSGEETWLSGGYYVSWDPAEITAGSYGHKEVSAKWTPRDYPIIYDTNGGVGSATSASVMPQSYTIESSISVLEIATVSSVVTKVGYRLSSITPKSVGFMATPEPHQMQTFNVALNWECLGYQLVGRTNENLSGGSLSITVDGHETSVATWEHPITFESINYGTKISVDVDPGYQTPGIPHKGYKIKDIGVFKQNGSGPVEGYSTWTEAHHEITMPSENAQICVLFTDVEGMIYFDPGY